MAQMNTILVRQYEDRGATVFLNDAYTLSDLVHLYKLRGIAANGATECGAARGFTPGWASVSSGEFKCWRHTPILHELGHQLGALHDEEAHAQKGFNPVRGFFTDVFVHPSGHGRTIRWHDIMAYPVFGCERQGGGNIASPTWCLRAPAFSSNGWRLPFNGGSIPLGDESHDNLGYMLCNHNVVANYR